MKIPRIYYPKRGKHSKWIIVVLKEGHIVDVGEGFHRIWCHTKKQVDEIIKYFLEYGEIKYWMENFWKDRPDKLTHIKPKRMNGAEKKYKATEYPDIKLYVWKAMRRVRKRPKEIGGNINEKV